MAAARVSGRIRSRWDCAEVIGCMQPHPDPVQVSDLEDCLDTILTRLSHFCGGDIYEGSGGDFDQPNTSSSRIERGYASWWIYGWTLAASMDSHDAGGTPGLGWTGIGCVVAQANRVQPVGQSWEGLM